MKASESSAGRKVNPMSPAGQLRIVSAKILHRIAEGHAAKTTRDARMPPPVDMSTLLYSVKKHDFCTFDGHVTFVKTKI